MANNSRSASSRKGKGGQKTKKNLGSQMASMSLVTTGRRRNNALSFPRSINEKPVPLVFRSQSYNLSLQALIAPAAANSYYRAYCRFFTNSGESIVQNPTVIMSNTTNPGVYNFGIVPDNELASWAYLYSNIRLLKIKVSYQPSVTQGLVTSTSAATLAAYATLTDVPILDNIDDIISSGASTLAIAPTAAAYSHIKQRPFVKEHSIYKPWTRVFVPKFFELIYSPNVGQTSVSGIIEPKSSPWMDLSELSGVGAGVDPLDGLLLFMAPLSYGGITTAGVPPTYPAALNDSFSLGRLEFEYLLQVKSRI
jgi:hypothetical protein